MIYVDSTLCPNYGHISANPYPKSLDQIEDFADLGFYDHE